MNSGLCATHVGLMRMKLLGQGELWSHDEHVSYSKYRDSAYLALSSCDKESSCLRYVLQILQIFHQAESGDVHELIQTQITRIFYGWTASLGLRGMNFWF